jgi:Flp pilus assembly protein TadG
LTAGSAITITNNAGAITIAAAVRPTTDQATATAGQTSFTLAQAPLNAKVWMFINGVRTNNNAYTISSTTVTYAPANNNGYVLVVGDRVQFDYCY